MNWETDGCSRALAIWNGRLFRPFVYDPLCSDANRTTALGIFCPGDTRRGWSDLQRSNDSVERGRISRRFEDGAPGGLRRAEDQRNEPRRGRGGDQGHGRLSLV